MTKMPKLLLNRQSVSKTGDSEWSIHWQGNGVASAAADSTGFLGKVLKFGRILRFKWAVEELPTPERVLRTRYVRRIEKALNENTSLVQIVC